MIRKRYEPPTPEEAHASYVKALRSDLRKFHAIRSNQIRAHGGDERYVHPDVAKAIGETEAALAEATS